MKGRYNGRTVNVYSEIPGYTRLASIPVLSKKARQRLITGEVFRHKTIKLKLGYKKAAKKPAKRTTRTKH
jgi:hypothetical protein